MDFASELNIVRDFLAGGRFRVAVIGGVARALRIAGMSSHEGVSGGPLDLARDVPTTPEDVAALRQLRREVPSWFSLTLFHGWWPGGR